MKSYNSKASNENEKPNKQIIGGINKKNPLAQFPDHKSDEKNLTKKSSPLKNNNEVKQSSKFMNNLFPERFKQNKCEKIPNNCVEDDNSKKKLTTQITNEGQTNFKFVNEFEKLNDGFQIIHNLFSECTRQNKCDGNHNDCVEKDNSKNKLCTQIIVYHLMIQSLMNDKQKEATFPDEVKKILGQKFREFDKFLKEMKRCCQRFLGDQIKDLNEILKLQYSQIRIRIAKSQDPRAKIMDKKLMQSNFNEVLNASNNYHFQKLKNRDLKNLEMTKKTDNRTDKDFGNLKKYIKK